ncbi:hypothetical protein [Methanococcoides burtonii]|nr:hypothetical protein [Methanococcoides burtonii]
MNTKRKEILAVYEQGPEAVVTLVTTLYDIIAGMPFIPTIV